MKWTVLAVVSGVISTSGLAADSQTVLKDQKDKVSYSIGLNIGNTLKQQSLDLNPETLTAGIRDVLSGAKPLLTEEEVKQTLMAFQQEMLKQTQVKAETNKKAGDTFLAENKKKPGVETLPSGLQYKVIKVGKGKKPKSTDSVTTHYRGTLIDGTEFDSSYKSNEPASFPLTDVISGWTEALQLMPVGSKWQLFIPSNLAYGEGGRGPIPPNSALVFDLELLSIDAPDKAKK